MSLSKVEIDGLDELIKAFAGLGENAIYKLGEPSTQAAQVVLNKAKPKIHDVTGELNKNLKVTKPGKQKSGSYKVFAKVGFGKGAMHGVPLELGHKLVIHGNQVGAVKERPFLRPAADESKEAVANILTDAMNEILDQMGGKK